MDGDCGQTIVADGQRDDTEIHRILDDRLQNFCVVGAGNADRNIRVLFLEMCKDFGKDMQASPFVSTDDDFAPGNALGFGDCGYCGFSRVQRVFGEFQEQFAGCGERYLSAGAVEQFGADFFLKRANL